MRLHYASAAGEGLTLARRVTVERGLEGQLEREKHQRMSGRVHVHKERNDRCAAELQISSTRSKERESHSQKFSSAPGLRTVRSANTISEGRPGKQTGASLLAASPGDHETWARTDGRFPHAQTPLRPSPVAPSPLFAYPNHCCSA